MRKIVILLYCMMISFCFADTKEIGIASWYSIKTNGGTHTASGQKLNNEHHTAAHKTLKFGTLVRVTNLKNGKSEIVKITDRGPYVKGRIIDVTSGIAEKLGFKHNGITKVKIEIIKHHK